MWRRSRRKSGGQILRRRLIQTFNNNSEELRVLADTCLLQVSKPLKKEAIEPITVGLVGVGALFAALYIQQHISFTNDGFEKNHQKLISEIDDILNGSSSFGIGYDYKSDFKTMLQDFKSQLENFYSLYKQNESVINSFEKPKASQPIHQSS